MYTQRSQTVITATLARLGDSRWFWIGAVAVLASVLFVVFTVPTHGTGSSTAEPYDDYQYFNVTAPSVFQPNETQDISFTVHNTGDTWWYHGSAYQFVRIDNEPLDLTCGGVDYAHIPYKIHSKSSGHTPFSASWSCSLTAPATPGTYTLEMKMRHNADWPWHVEPSHTKEGAPDKDVLFGDAMRITITVEQATPAPTVDLSANPTTVSHGGSSILNWNVANATSCNASGDWSGSKNANGGSQTVSNLTSNTSYTLTCTGPGGSASDDAAVSITALDPPTVQLTANPTTVDHGGSSTLSWSVTNATSCNASGDWSGSKNANGGSQTVSNLTSNTSYTLTCTGPGSSGPNDSVSDSATVTVRDAAPPTVDLTADPDIVSMGGSTTLGWTVTNATSCLASNGWTGSKNANGGSEVRTNLTTQQTYVLTCSGPGGSVADTVTVQVHEPNKPVVDLTADPSTLQSGGSTTLTWTVLNATSCTASNGWSGSKNASFGTETRTNVTTDTTYALTCTGPGGSSSDTTTVHVTQPPTPAPTVTLAADPHTITSGGSTTLNWVVTNATSCNASGNWSGSKNANGGSENLSNITTNKTYILTCSGPGGASSDDATVFVQNEPQPAPSVSLTANPSIINPGGSTILNWSVNNATSCSASNGWTGSKNTNGGAETRANVQNDTTYKLTCSGPGGTASDIATVQVRLADKPVVVLEANPTSVASGESTVLTWTVLNATSCNASGDWSGSKDPNHGTLVRSNITSHRTYLLTCEGNGGSTTDIASVSVHATTAPPHVSLVANPSVVTSGGSTTLSWSVVNADHCSASGNWFGSKNAFGSSEHQTNITSNRTYVLTCTGPGGSDSDSATVSVQETTGAPNVSLVANPTTVSSGGSTTLSWFVTNATVCNASNGWTGSKNANGGSEGRFNLTTTRTYTITCTGPGGSDSDSATVSVQSTPAPESSPIAGIVTDQNGAPVQGIQVETCHWGVHTTNENGQWSVSVPERSNFCARVVNLSSDFTGSTSNNNTPETASANTYEFQVSDAFCRTDGCDAGVKSTWDIADDLRNDFTVFRATTPPPPPPGPPAPTLTFTANPTTVTAGGSSLLSWSSTNTTSCNASGNWLGFKALSGSESTGALQQTQTYVLTCSGNGGTVTQSVSVAVEAPALPIITLSAINLDTLEWEATNANTCQASGNWSGIKPLTGRQFIGLLTPQTQYLLTCTGAGGTVTVAASGVPESIAATFSSFNNFAGTTNTGAGGTTGTGTTDTGGSGNTDGGGEESGFLAAILGGSLGATLLFWFAWIIAIIAIIIAVLMATRKENNTTVHSVPTHAHRTPEVTPPAV